MSEQARRNTAKKNTVGNLMEELSALQAADAKKTKRTGKSLTNAEQLAVQEKVWAEQDKKNTK